MNANAEAPVTRERYSRDARYVAQKAEAYVKESGVGDTVYIGPELEFFIFDEARFASDQHSSLDRKSTRLHSSHAQCSYAVFCLKKKLSAYI